MPTPYAEQVAGRDPVPVMRSSLNEYRDVTRRFTSERWKQPWQPGKWTAQQIMIHVTQWELIFATRLRCGLAVPGYVAQPFDQDDLMKREGHLVDGPTAFAAFDAVRVMHIALAESLSADDRTITFQHAERGTIDVEDLLVTLAGHPVHHLKQLRGMV